MCVCMHACMCAHTHIHTEEIHQTVLRTVGEHNPWEGNKEAYFMASVKYRIITKTRLADAPGKQEFSRQP